MKLILFGFIFLIFGCATWYPRLESSLSEIYPKISNSLNFAFVQNGDHYFFAPNFFKHGDDKCYLYLGFKNEKLTYAFSNDVYFDVEKIYNGTDNPDEIKKKLLARLEGEKAAPSRCHELREVPVHSPDSGQAILIVLAPLVVPFMIPDLANTVQLRSLHSQLNREIKLGMSEKEMPPFVRKAWQLRSKGKSKYYEFQQHGLRVIFYFEDNALNGWSQTLEPSVWLHYW